MSRFSENRLYIQNERSHSGNQDFDHLSDVSNQSEQHISELAAKAKYQEEEILHLKKQLGDFAIKEQQLLNEKHVLQKRVADMRIAFDRQQQDFVDAAAKAISYRQDIIEENVRLTYALQDAQHERLVFMSLLLPLLMEYNLQPAVASAQSVVSNTRILVRHLHERVNLNEAALRDNEHRLKVCQPDARIQPSALYSPLDENQQNLHQLSEQAPITSPTYTAHQKFTQQNQQSKASSNNIFQYNGSNTVEAPFSIRDEPPKFQFPSNAELMANKNMQAPLIQNSETTKQNYDASTIPENYATRHERDNKVKQNSTEFLGQSSTISNEDELLPGIEDLQIVGEAKPGDCIQACGFPVNGTRVCNFEWVRHLQDGSICFIEGANQPEYTVTADDVDTILAVECVPIDDQNQKGKLFKVFANNKNKVTCDQEMQQRIESFVKTGHAEFDILILAVGSEVWEHATLILRRSNYEIYLNRQSPIVRENYSPEISVKIPYGYPTQCVLTTADGRSYPLDTSEDVKLRDMLVLTLRLFQRKAMDRRKGKQRVTFS